jgi:homoserine dehydrogenase
MAKPLRIGVAGLGSVGAALVRLLRRRRADLLARTGRDIAVVAVSARSRRDRGLALDGVAFHADATALAASGDIDLFVEVIGGADGAAYDSARAALSRGLPLVTANKAMLAAHGLELGRLAE